LWPRTLTMPHEVDVLVQRAPDQPGGRGDDASPTSDVADNDGVVLRGPVRGRALVGALVMGALEAGVRLRTGARASALVVQGGSIVGADVEGERIDGCVVLATGGFQHDAGLVADYFPGAPVVAMGPPGCRGDGLAMAKNAGAALANMDEGWWMPSMRVPGERFEGVAYYRPLHAERAKPGSIMVDGHGRRFVDEARNYGDVGRAMRTAVGPASAVARSADPGHSCWLLFDAGYRRRYPVGPLEPVDADPAWLMKADDLAGLARAIDVPATTLTDTVASFNAGAVTGEDPEFGRGSLAYDRWIGDHAADHPTLAPLTEAPFYALKVHLGCMGTKGGPRTDDRGRVLADTGRVVEGVYAAGNVAASVFGSATPAGGATLGPALVFGFRAGEAAAGDR
ncbi:MAG TPA: FAD-binding protein, partial [Acidimicrobiales bacterium]|nr:FAD-binding protein [Acidimicrobiales bacterium]